MHRNHVNVQLETSSAEIQSPAFLGRKCKHVEKSTQGLSVKLVADELGLAQLRKNEKNENEKKLLLSSSAYV